MVRYASTTTAIRWLLLLRRTDIDCAGCLLADTSTTIGTYIVKEVMVFSLRYALGRVNGNVLWYGATFGRHYLSFPSLFTGRQCRHVFLLMCPLIQQCYLFEGNDSRL
jgi:hypothetical protein